MSDPQQQQPSESHCDFATPTSAGRRTNRQRTSKDAAYAWRLVNSTEVGQRCRKKNRMSGSCSPGDGRQNCSDSNGAGPRLSAPSGTKKRKRGRQPGWSCSACTLLNSNRRRKCEACQNQRDSNDDQQQLVTDKAALNAVANANDTNLSLPPPRSQSRSRRSSSSSGGSVTDWLRRRKIKSGKESRSFSGCQSSVQTATSIVADFSNNRHFTPKQSVKVRVCYGNHLLSSDSGPLIADIPCMVWARVSTGFVKSTVEDEAKQKREKENAFEMLVGPTELKAALQLSGQVCDTNEEDPASDDNIFRAQTLSDSLSPDGAQDQNQEHNPPVKIGEGVESITRCGRTDFARTPLNNILVEEDDKNLMESETATSSLPIYSFVQNTDNNLGRCNREKGSEAAIDDVSFDGKTAIHLNHKQHTREAISIACKPLIDLTSSSPVLYSQQFTASVSQNCQTLTPGVESFEYSLTQQNFDYRDTSEQQLQNQENMVLPDPIFVHGDAHNPSTHSSPPLSSSVAMTKPPPSLSLASGQGGFRSTFATAGKGAAISVSEEAMDKARKLLGEQSEARSAPPSSAPPPPSLSLASGQGGFRSTFATAGKGAAISVSEEAMDKARKLLGDQSGARSAPPSSAPPPPSLSLASGQGGFRSTFATAGKGAAISVSEEAMDKARKLLGDQSGARSAPPSSAPPPPSLSLASGQGGFRSTFATAGKGAAISVSEEAMDKARKLLGDQSGARSAPPSSAPPPPSLSLASGQGGFRSTFATAGKGAAISVSEEAMDKAQKIFGQQSSSALLSQKALSIDKDVIEYMDERSGVSTIPLMRKKALVFDDTCTPFIRRRSMGRVSFGEATNGMLAEHLHPTETPLPGKSKRPRHFSTNKVLFGKDPFELSESSLSAYSGVSNTSVRSKVMSTFTPKNSSRVVKGTALVTRSTTIKNPYARKQLDVSSHGAVTPVPFNFIGGTFAVRKFSPRSLAKAERILQKPNRNSHPEPGRSATVPPRSILYAQQSLWSDKKEIAHFQFSPSSDERISLRELDTRIGPMVRSASECVELGLSADLLEVNSTNAAKIRFYEGSGLPCNVLGDASYGVSKLVGSVKDVRQKLVNLGCNDSLLTDRWILNHLGWINWKLASTERRFPGVLGGKYLNYEHVIGQLQRRFKKEIRDTKRPAVRLVLNRDVPSSRLMILCVSQIKKSRVPRAGIELAVGAEGDRAASSHKKEFCLELTDGWYPIPAVMDEHLQTFVKEDKIKVGSKLLISSAELVGAEDGIDPLDDSYYTSRPNFSVALKLVANATRLAKWDAKLGFVRPTPTVQSCDGLLLVRSLAGVIPGGGNIPLIDFVISRRFPVMYLEKRNGTASVILTKAQEERHQREFDEKRDREVEKIAEGLEKECTKLVDEHAPEKWKEMISSTSMCDYYEGLSAQDRASVDAWKDKRSSMIRDKTNQAVDSRIQSNESMNRKSIPFCRFSVLSFLKQRLPVDTESDDDEGVVLVCKQAIATLTVWRMSEDQCNLLKEGSVVRMKHLSVLDGFRNGQLQLSANDKTKMQSCPTQTSSSQIKLSGYTKRFYTSIVRIHALSRKAATSRNRIGVDFVGCLVRLNIDEKGIAPLVSAYFTDESGLLLRLQRQGEGIGDSNILAWGKKLVEGKALSFRDVDILPYDFSANCAVAAWSLVTVEEKVAKTTCRKIALQKGENSIHTSSMASFDAMLPLHSRLSGNAEIAVGYILSLRIDCDARGARGKETGSKCHLIDIDCSGAAGVITATCPQSVLFQTLQLHLADCSRHGEAMANTQNYLQGKINHGANHDETASLETLFVESGILFQVTLRRESCHAIGECELRVVQMAPANTDALASLYWESLTAHNM